MTITINSSNIEAIFGDASGAVERPPTPAREPAVPTGAATYSIFARRPRRRPGEAREPMVGRPGTAAVQGRGARHAS